MGGNSVAKILILPTNVSLGSTLKPGSHAAPEGPPLSRPENVVTSLPPGVLRACLQLPRLPRSRVRRFPPDDIVSVTQLVPLRTATPAVTRQQIKVDAGSARSSLMETEADTLASARHFRQRFYDRPPGRRHPKVRHDGSCKAIPRRFDGRHTRRRRVLQLPQFHPRFPCLRYPPTSAIGQKQSKSPVPSDLREEAQQPSPANMSRDDPAHASREFKAANALRDTFAAPD
ncbi:hypothetical protein HPB47_001811 [Ixodes persulcatus]|uniref:Uncharacterized protein n=1 Tax=Ixodes persulcatus TaxID=34615 RepID=A0AC60PN65_IXOPE|nr:hypothetical protein HPB47_001811 [Ixodes persulcatus]